jgi:hypothetical protein
MQVFGKKWHIRQARIGYIGFDMIDHQSPLVGTWKLAVSRSQTGLPPFSAMQTFFADGLLTGATNALGRNTESPGHGVWRGEGGVYTGVLEVFSFDESGELTGVVRMRSEIRMDEPDRIRGEMAVDVFPIGKEPQFDVDAAAFEGVRLKAFTKETTEKMNS